MYVCWDQLNLRELTGPNLQLSCLLLITVQRCLICLLKQYECTRVTICPCHRSPE